MTEEDKIEVLTRSADRALQKEPIPFRKIRLRNRFQQWGPSTSKVLLESMEELGYTIKEISDGGGTNRD